MPASVIPAKVSGGRVESAPSIALPLFSDPQSFSAIAPLYGALSRLMLEEADTASLEALRDLPSDPRLDQITQSLVRELATAAAEASENDCRREFSRLFLNPRGAPCKPWESTWRENPPRLMGESHESVLQMYSDAGFHPRTLSDPADHVALELAFVALLANRRAAGRPDDGLLERFVSEHIVTWLPQFARKLRDAAHLPLYHAAARLLEFLVTPSAPLPEEGPAR